MSNVTENPQVFKTRQFMAGNSPAVRIPVSMAFAHQTELCVTRVGDRSIVEPQAPTLEGLAELFAELGKHHSGERVEFEEQERDWS